MAEIKSLCDVMGMKLTIPNYQRPYKWHNRNVFELLDDINTALTESQRFSDYSYRIGTVILYKEEDRYSIVDGQQRLITISLIIHYLDPGFDCSLFGFKTSNKITKSNIRKNYECIKDWFSLKNEDYKQLFKKTLETVVEVVVVTVDDLTSAFQLFDSQNSRGKELDPHDLLKAFHLREMRSEYYEMMHCVNKWESFKPSDISGLFEAYLFPILNWTGKEKTQHFCSIHIDHYKGISEESNYTYARRARKSSPYFQISEPFTSGKDFFDMVEHYLTMLNDINNELANNVAFSEVNEILNSNKSIGFRWASNLFRCAVFCYYDKFHNFDEQAIKKLFVWSFMLRVDMRNLGFDSVNKYASGDYEGDKYTNHIPVFSLIKKARHHTEISNMMVIAKRTPDTAGDDKWNGLYSRIKIIAGLGE